MVANAGGKSCRHSLSGDRRTGRTEARAADRRGQRRPRRGPDRRRREPRSRPLFGHSWISSPSSGPSPTVRTAVRPTTPICSAMSAANATPTTSRSRRDRFRSSRFRSVRLETASSAPSPSKTRWPARPTSIRACWPAQPRHPLRRRGQPARRPPRRRDPRLGRERRQHRRARRHQHLPPRQLHPHRHDEPRGGRSAPPTARSLRSPGHRRGLSRDRRPRRDHRPRARGRRRRWRRSQSANGVRQRVETLRDDLVAAREAPLSVGLPTDFKAEIAELCLEAGGRRPPRRRGDGSNRHDAGRARGRETVIEPDIHGPRRTLPTASGAPSRTNRSSTCLLEDRFDDGSPDEATEKTKSDGDADDGQVTAGGQVRTRSGERRRGGGDRGAGGTTDPAMVTAVVRTATARSNGTDPGIRRCGRATPDSC